MILQSRQRAQQSMQRRERQRSLNLEALRAQDDRCPGGTHQFVEKSGLADARLATQDDAAGRPVPRRLHRPGQQRQLLVAAYNHPATVHAWTTRGLSTWRFGRGDVPESRRDWQ